MKRHLHDYPKFLSLANLAFYEKTKSDTGP